MRFQVNSEVLAHMSSRLWQLWVRTLSQLVTLSPNIYPENARSTILKINPLPVLVNMLSYNDAGSAASALTALKVTGEGRGIISFQTLLSQQYSCRSARQSAV